MRASPGTGTALLDADIQLGAVEIKDQDSSVRADVLDLTTNDGLAVAVLDGTGAQVTDFMIGTDFSNVLGTASVIGAGTEAGAIRVTVATDSTGVLSIDDNGGSLTVDGTFWQATQPVSLASVPSHAVTNAGTFAVQADSVIPGTGATNLGKAEDAAHTTGDTGVMMLGVRNANQSALTSTEGDYSPIATDDVGRVRILSDILIPGTGATNLGKAVDTAGGATDTGVANLAIRDDALGVLTPIEGDYVNLRVDANGALWTHDDALDAALGGSELQVDVVAALPAGTNAIGKLAANSGVDIGDVDILSIAAGDNNIGNVDIVTVPAPLNVTGTGLEATALRVTLASDSTGVLSVDDNGGNLSIDWAGTVPPIGAGTEAAALRVTVATDSTGVLSVDDNSGSLTVDGTITANAGTGTFTVDSELPAAAALADAASAAPTTPTVGAVPLLMNATTIDRARAVVNALDSTGTGIAAAGIVGQLDDATTGTVTENQFAPVRISSRRALLVEGVASGTVIPVSDGGGNLSVDWAGTVPPIGAGTEAAALRVTVATDSTGVVSVDDNGGNISVDWAGTVPPIGAGTEAAALRVTLATDSTGVVSVDDNGGALTVDGTITANAGTGTFATSNAIVDGWDNAASDGASVSGDVAHDAADAGEPVKIGFKAETSLKGITLVADGDRTNGYADADGVQVVKIGTTGADKISERVANTDGASTAFTNFSAVASTYNYIESISIWNSSATNGYVDFRDGTAGSVLWTMAAPTLGGSVMAVPGGIFKTSANTALAFDVSGALSTVYISVSGYQAKV